MYSFYLSHGPHTDTPPSFALLFLLASFSAFAFATVILFVVLILVFYLISFSSSPFFLPSFSLFGPQILVSTYCPSSRVLFRFTAAQCSYAVRFYSALILLIIFCDFVIMVEGQSVVLKAHPHFKPSTVVVKVQNAECKVHATGKWHCH